MPDTPTDSPFQNKTLMAVSVVIGLAAAILVWLYVDSIEKRYSQNEFVVWETTKTIEPDERVRPEEDLRPIRVPNIYKGRLGDVIADAPGETKERDTYTQQPALIRIRRGTLLRVGFFSGETNPLSDVTPAPGHRLVAIPVDSS